MQILGLLGIYFDDVVVFVKKTSLLFRLALAILWFVLTFFINFNFQTNLFCKNEPNHSFILKNPDSLLNLVNLMKSGFKTDNFDL